MAGFWIAASLSWPGFYRRRAAALAQFALSRETSAALLASILCVSTGRHAARGEGVEKVEENSVIAGGMLVDTRIPAGRCSHRDTTADFVVRGWSFVHKAVNSSVEKEDGIIVLRLLGASGRSVLNLTARRVGVGAEAEEGRAGVKGFEQQEQKVRSFSGTLRRKPVGIDLDRGAQEVACVVE